MKKHYLLLLAFTTLLFGSINAQFGIFATGIAISQDGGATSTWYAVNPPAGNPNAIGATTYGSTSLGTFAQYSGLLKVTGGEIKTFKGPNDNVCGGRVSWRVYPVGSPGGAFEQFTLSFKADCSGGVFNDGFGPCSTGDQKWQRTGLMADLTNYQPGTYTLEIYFEAFGANGSTTACNQTVVDNNNFNYYRALFTIDGTLPVKLVNFSGAKSNEGVKLAWETALERNFSRFELERSTDGVNFGSVTTVRGRGNTNLRSRYSYVDRTAPTGNLYYRLKIIDTDGKFTYSSIINANLRSALLMKVSPNPVSAQLQLEGVSTGDRVSITNMLGVNVYSQIAGGNLMRINVSNLAKGKYNITVSNGSTVSTIGFIKE